MAETPRRSSNASVQDASAQSRKTEMRSTAYQNLFAHDTDEDNESQGSTNMAADRSRSNVLYASAPDFLLSGQFRHQPGDRIILTDGDQFPESGTEDDKESFEIVSQAGAPGPAQESDFHSYIIKYRRDLEAGRSFDVEDDLEYCPHEFLTEDDFKVLEHRRKRSTFAHVLEVINSPPAYLNSDPYRHRARNSSADSMANTPRIHQPKPMRQEITSFLPQNDIKKNRLKVPRSRLSRPNSKVPSSAGGSESGRVSRSNLSSRAPAFHPSILISTTPSGPPPSNPHAFFIPQNPQNLEVPVAPTDPGSLPFAQDHRMYRCMGNACLQTEPRFVQAGMFCTFCGTKANTKSQG